MTTTKEPLRLVSVLTHRDDEPAEGAATLARNVAAGHEVMVVFCTGDKAGDDVRKWSEARMRALLRIALPRLTRGAGRDARWIHPPGRRQTH